MENDCIFCKIIRGEIPADKLYEDPDVFVFLSNQPNNLGHTLVIPKVHAENILTITPKDFLAVMRTVHTLAPLVTSAMNAAGVNIIMNNGTTAGQAVFHAHVHIIPRHEGDGFQHWKGRDFTRAEIASSATQIKNMLSSDSVGA